METMRRNGEPIMVNGTRAWLLRRLKPATTLFLLCAISSSAQDTSRTSVTTFRTVPNNAFKPGEKLVFSVDWGFINAGEATMAVEDTMTQSGRVCYRIKTTAGSNAFFSAFYPVRDTVESRIDRDGLFSWYFRKKLQEGDWWMDQTIEYDQHGHMAYTLVDRKKRKTKTDSLAIPEMVQDILSVFYYIRTQDLKAGTTVSVTTQADKKVYPLEVHVIKKEKINVPAGEFNCLKVEPKLKTTGIFKQKGRLWVWLTDDERKLPVLMKSKIKVGSISTRLKEY